jgi:hypothetical protein
VSWQREPERGVKRYLRHDLVLLIYVCVHDDCMNATNKRMCLGYKETMCARSKIREFKFMDPPEW